MASTRQNPGYATEQHTQHFAGAFVCIHKYNVILKAIYSSNASLQQAYSLFI